jgi:hypothetical protein
MMKGVQIRIELLSTDPMFLDPKATAGQHGVDPEPRH